MTMIEAHSDKPWDWNRVSLHMKLTVDLLTQYRDKPWDFYSMSKWNPSITLELVLATPDLPWNYEWLSFNKCLTKDMLLAFPDKIWNWYNVSCNKGITMSDTLVGIQIYVYVILRSIMISHGIGIDYTITVLFSILMNILINGYVNIV